MDTGGERFLISNISLLLKSGNPDSKHKVRLMGGSRGRLLQINTISDSISWNRVDIATVSRRHPLNTAFSGAEQKKCFSYRNYTAFGHSGCLSLICVCNLMDGERSQEKDAHFFPMLISRQATGHATKTVCGAKKKKLNLILFPFKLN